MRRMRRGRGALEAEVLALLWATGEARSPEEVRAELGDELAYTTVATILGRLHEKGVVRREARGRGFAYAAIVDEAGLAARRMRAVLDAEDDRAGVLSRFVADLDNGDLSKLREALGDGEP